MIITTIFSLGLLLAPTPVLAADPVPSIDDPLRTSSRHPDDVALVIGNEDYTDVPDVPYALRDARAFRDLLVHTRGIPEDRLMLIEGATRQRMLDAVDELALQSGPDTVFWFYFAGHGAADPSSRERVLLGDTVKRNQSDYQHQSAPLSEIEQRATAQGARVVMVLDACYSGLGRDGEALSDDRPLVPTYSRPDNSQAVVWSAAGPDEQAGPIHPARHGLFTYFTIGALRGWADGALDGQADGVITLDEAHSYVQAALRGVESGRTQQPSLERRQDAPDMLFSSHTSERAPDLRAIELAMDAWVPPPTVRGIPVGPRDRRALRTTLALSDVAIVAGSITAIIVGAVKETEIKADLESGEFTAGQRELAIRNANTAFAIGYGGLGVSALAGVGLFITRPDSAEGEEGVPVAFGLELAF